MEQIPEAGPAWPLPRDALDNPTLLSANSFGEAGGQSIEGDSQAGGGKNWRRCLGNIEDARLLTDNLKNIVSDMVYVDDDVFNGAKDITKYIRRIKVRNYMKGRKLDNVPILMGSVVLGPFCFETWLLFQVWHATNPSGTYQHA